jgi:cell wall-associated NlpC family hydrolase
MNAGVLAEYLSLPYKISGRERDDGVDCWGLIRLMLSEQRGIELPSYDLHGVDIRNHSGSMIPLIAIEAAEQGWQLVEPPFKRWDLVFFRIGTELHIGLMLDGTHFIGAMPKVGVAIQSLSRQVWAGTRIGAYRHVKH